MNVTIDDRELMRLKRLSIYEDGLYADGYGLVAGVDEVGRGPLAGPVMACAVILPQGCVIPGVDDSKRLTEKKRNKLFELIGELAIDISYGLVDVKEIDEINILQAARLAMIMAVNGLKAVDAVLLDGLPIPGMREPSTPITGGDQKSVSIAAASIMAKVARDRLMCEYDKQYPEYAFCKNKGYGTKQHLEAIEKYGICGIHRRSFAPCKTFESGRAAAEL